MELVAIVALAVALGLLLGRLVMPPRRPNALQRAWTARAMLRRARRRHEDPFETLQIQLQLTRLSRELDSLDADIGRFARAHHMRAAQTAYDDLLERACGIAGIELDDAHGGVRRLMAESALRRRGWTW